MSVWSWDSKMTKNQLPFSLEPLTLGRLAEGRDPMRLVRGVALGIKDSLLGGTAVSDPKTSGSISKS